MALKTFNISEEIHKKFSRFCKKHGISMSKQVENFMASQVEDEPAAKDEYISRLEKMRKGSSASVKGSEERPHDHHDRAYG